MVRRQPPVAFHVRQCERSGAQSSSIGKRGTTGYRLYPYEYPYETLGLHKLPDSRAAVAKAWAFDKNAPRSCS
jgi:hypothetical protein